MKILIRTCGKKLWARPKWVSVTVIVIMAILIFPFFQKTNCMAQDIQAQDSPIGGNVQVSDESGIGQVSQGQDNAEYQQQPLQVGDIQIDPMTAIDLSNVPDEPENPPDIRIEIPVELTNLYAVVDKFRLWVALGKEDEASPGRLGGTIDDYEAWYITREVNRNYSGTVIANINVPAHRPPGYYEVFSTIISFHNRITDEWEIVHVCDTDCSDGTNLPVGGDEPWHVGNIGSYYIRRGYIE